MIGILPGAGASIACFMGYNSAQQFSKHKEEFGHGAIEGVAGSEAANNAVTGGSLIPMLTLGIPGESVTAVLMGGLIIQGLTPGPDLFVGETAKMTYTFFAGFVLIQFFMLGIGLLGCRGFAQISRLSDAILIPAVSVLCVVGSYAIHKNFVDVVIMMIFGVLGYLCRKFDLNTAAIVLALSVSIVPLTTGALVLFLFGALLLIAGVGVFTLGVDMSMTPMGSAIGMYMSRARHSPSLWR